MSADTRDQDLRHPDWIVSEDDVRNWYEAHPGTFAGSDVVPIILNERLAMAAQQLLASRPSVPDAVLEDQLRLLWRERQSEAISRRSMLDGLAARTAAYATWPRRPDVTVSDAVPVAEHTIGDERAAHPTPLAPRRSGRPPWTKELFLERFGEAERAASMDEDGRRRRLGREPSLPDIAVEFRRLDGTCGISQERLRRLRRRFRSEA